MLERNYLWKVRERCMTRPHLEVLEALHAMPPEKRNQKFLSPWGDLCSIASVLKIFISHEMDHADDLEERLNKAGNMDN